jgi:serine/threonine protein kinase/tetratricopeptide (TPR) repeat protein
VEDDLSAPPTDANSESPTRSVETLGGDSAGVIGPYKLIELIGEGGMGVVYRARQLQPLRRDVALKIIKPGMDSRQVILRFESERQALALMDHPNIAHVLDAGTTERGLPYFVMELMDGVPITSFCDAKDLTIRQRVELFIQVSNAIQHAHQKGIIHRDIKPSNVLVTQLEGRPVPKVIDFGLAKALAGHIADASVMTSVGSMVGTLEYMSPEQAELGRRDIDTRTDIYSLAAVLYELLTGVTPLDRESLTDSSYVQILSRIRDEEPKRPSTRLKQLGQVADSGAPRQSDPTKVRPALGEELDWIVMKALEKDRTRRYETVNGMARDLQRYLAGEPVEAAPPSATYRLRKFVHRHLTGVLAAAAIILMLLASSIVSWMFYRSAVREKARAESRFADVRSLARFVLFDFDQAISAGATPARQAVVQKATEYLDRLASDRGNDVSLARELVDGYLKVGDLQGNPMGPNLGDRTAAKRSYEHALRIAESTPSVDPATPAEIRIRIADVLFAEGAIKEAVGVYQKANEVLDASGIAGDRKRVLLLNNLSKLCFGYSSLSDYADAIPCYVDMGQRAREYSRTNPEESRFKTNLAVAELRLGDARARSGDLDDGLPFMLHAIAMAEEMAAASPNSPSALRFVCVASGVTGDVLRLAGQYGQASRHFRRALEITTRLLENDTRNEQLQRDRVGFLARLAESIGMDRNITECCDLTAQAKRASRPLAEKPNASELDIQGYAWILLATPCARLRDPVRALTFVQPLVAGSGRQDPSYLLMLAQAYAGIGDTKRAIWTLEEAQKLLSPNDRSDLRGLIEMAMAGYRKGLRWVPEDLPKGWLERRR